MITYSKLLPYTCYELGHTWHHSCTKSSFDMFISAGYTSLKIYAAAYLLTFLVSRKFTRRDIKKLLKNYLQSSLFLTYNGSFFVASFCVLRLILGRITFLSPGWLPGFFASILAIYVERVSRRSQLAIYVSNVASECLWNVLKARGYVTPIPGGEVMLFCASMMLFGYNYKSPSNSGSLVNSIIKFLIGKDEAVKNPKSGVDTSIESTAPLDRKSNYIYSRIYRWRHPKCPHKLGCITDLLKTAALAWMKGYTLIVCLRTYTSFTKIVKRPSTLLEILCKGASVKCGVAFALFSSLFKLTCCLARHLSNDDRPLHGALAGGLAGVAMAFYPSTTLSIYAAWKALEAVYEKGIEGGYLPVIPHGVELLYAFSTAYLFHVAILEHFNMKQSYWRFLMELSAGKIGEYNKALLDCYALDSGRQQVWPAYNKKYLTKEFIEKYYR